MELTKKINFRESKYMIPALIYFPLLFTGYFVIDMFGTKKAETVDPSMQTPEYAELVNNAIQVPAKADTRHLNAVKRIATAYCKLLFPHLTSADQIDKAEFDRFCLQPAIHRRDQVRQQCANIDNESSFSKPMPDIRVKL